MKCILYFVFYNQGVEYESGVRLRRTIDAFGVRVWKFKLFLEVPRWTRKSNPHRRDLSPELLESRTEIERFE